MEKTLLER